MVVVVVDVVVEVVVEVVDVDVVVSTATGVVVVVIGVALRPETRKAPKPRRAPRNKITRILEKRDMKPKIRPRTTQPRDCSQRAKRAAVPPQAEPNGGTVPARPSRAGR
jgi:hypothetical protein